MAQSPEEIIKAAYAALLDQGDLESFLAFFAEDGVLLEADSLPYGGRHTGVDAIRDALIKVMGCFSAFSFKPEIFATSGEWVIAYGTFAVTARESGMSISFPLAEVSHVVDGKIKLINPIYGDTALILNALA